jgi:translation initiation factor 2 subunit 3
MKEEKQAEINIGTIGHVDHGKTSLVKALTGNWTDKHSEEMKRGISIRLGYADTQFHYNQKNKTHTTQEHADKNTKPARKVSFVDAPGHETLMATMLSGAALMDGAIIVIAANEKCPQPRTEEHLMALNISGIKKIVAAQNKIDLVDKQKAKENHEEIKKFLKTHGYENTPIIPVSANKQININALIQAIEENIPTPKRDPKKELRMYAVRSFDVNRPGTKTKDIKGGVIGGSIIQGTLSEGDEIEISPGTNGTPIHTTATKLNTQYGNPKKAIPGGLIAIETKLDPYYTRNDALRGQIIGHKGKLPKPTTQLTLELHEFKRTIQTTQTLQLNTNEPIVLTAGTLTAVGIITKKKQNQIEIQLKNHIVTEPGQKIAISKKDGNKWRLAAYGTTKNST